MKKYGLQLRVQPSQQNRKPPRPPPPPASLGFGNDDEVDVEKEISRQASKNKSLKDVEEQHKKALEEDSTVFDYDGVYDKMKQEIARPRAQDREERKPKYIQTLIKKAEERQREHEIVYEKKLAKERTKDDHLYADKDKFVTSAYKKKLAEQAQWMEEERLRQIREEKEDVTKKSDLTDFYFNLGKNVAFGAEGINSKKHEKEIEPKKSGKRDDEGSADTSDAGPLLAESEIALKTPHVKEEHKDEVSKTTSQSLDHNPISDKPVSDMEVKEKMPVDPSSSDQLKPDHHKRNQDALAAAKERFLARKRAKEQ